MSATNPKRDSQKLRNYSRFLLLILITIHMIVWYVMGIHTVGSIGIEAMFYGFSMGLITAGVVFWITVFILTMFLGRAFCGWFCWFGGYQELVEWGMKKSGVEIPRRAKMYLIGIPVISLFLQIYYAWIITWIESPPTSFTIQFGIPQPWGQTQTIYSIIITLVLYGPMLIYAFDKRAWCRYICPIGALLRVFSLKSIGRVRLVNDSCTGCGTCNSSCAMMIDVIGELSTHSEVRSTDCISCLECTQACPHEAISFTFRKKNVTMSEKAKERAERSTLKIRRPSYFDAAVIGVWATITFTLVLSGFRKDAPIEIKTLMTAGMLFLVYGFIWTLNKARLRMVKTTELPTQE